MRACAIILFAARAGRPAAARAQLDRLDVHCQAILLDTLDVFTSAEQEREVQRA